MNTALRWIAISLVGISLTACITVFPKTEPTQLYRFGMTQGAASSTSTSRVGMVRSGGAFASASAGDGILTTTGTEVAYLAGARWAQPAAVLFEEAVARAFTTNTGPAELLPRGETARAAYTLRLEVQQFEAVYDRPGNAGPSVNTTVHVVVVRMSDRAVVKDQTLSVSQRASSNRVSAVVAAFDQAVSEVLGQILGLANEAAKPT